MAISQGSVVLQSDIKAKYDSFNTFITNYGGSIAKLTVPGQNTIVYASQFNALNGKVNEFKNETYLKTQASWWVAGPTVVAGQSLLDDANFTNINTTINNFAKVKCRNNAYRSHSNRSHSTNSHSTRSHSTRSHSTKSHSARNHSTRSHSTNSHGTHGNGGKGNGGQYNGNNSYGSCNGYGACTSNGNNGSYGTKDNGNKSHTNCGANGTCSNGNNGNTACTANGTCSGNGTCSNTTCGGNGTCKNTTYIDITNKYTNA